MADEAPTWFTRWVEHEFRPSIQRIEGRLDRIETKQQNAAKSSSEPLANVPLSDGTTTQVEYPYCLAHFMTPGNVALDNRLPANTPKWSRAKSLTLIRQYEPGYETDDGGEEGPSQKRRARCLARHLGFTNTQLEAWS
jgi:hypothetical protein